MNLDVMVYFFVVLGYFFMVFLVANIIGAWNIPVTLKYGFVFTMV